MLVRDVLNSDVLTVRPESTVEEAVNSLVQHGISGLPVTDADDNLLGVVTDYAVMSALYRPEIRSHTVASIMSTDVVTATEDDDVAMVAGLLMKHRIRRVPVVRGAKLVGLISRGDLVRCAGQQMSPKNFAWETLADLAIVNGDLSGHERSPQIFVIDDSPLIHELVRDALGPAGYRLTFCFSGVDALAGGEIEAADLILLDRVLPGLDGLDTLRLLRKNKETCRTPVIMITSCDRATHVAEALQVGAVDYINKPFSAIDLQARIASALRTRKMQRELEEAGARAESATQSKSEFLANMSHEIRTPLTAILGFADLLYDLLEDPECLTAADTIRRNGQHLLEIINDILDLSKIEAGKIEIERLCVSPVELVTDVLDLMRVRADEKRLNLTVEYTSQIPESIQTDPTRLRQVLVNLIGNALKFTDTGSVRLVVNFAVGPPQLPSLSFEVHDTGIGMSPEQVTRLFRPFTQADASTTRQYGGTGLGLAISSRLAEKLGGKISVESERHVGSSFSFSVDTGPLDEIPLIDPDRVCAANAAAVAHKPSRPAPAAAVSGKVLLAEDGRDNQRLIRTLLNKAGIEVTVVENGKLAYETALAARQQDCPFDVILMDMQMPEWDGYRAVERLRADGYDGPIVALTANAMEGDRRRCLQAGCNDYHAKPIQRDVLLAMVARWIASDESVPAPA